MIRNNELYILDARGVEDKDHRPRSLATLNALNKAVMSYQGQLPDIEFTLTDHDSAGLNKNGDRITWTYSRLDHQDNLWVIPDSGFWSSPSVGLRSYSEFQDILEDSEDDFLDKITELVWRGALKDSGGGEALVQESEGQVWSDVKTLDWTKRNQCQGELHFPRRPLQLHVPRAYRRRHLLRPSQIPA